MSKLNLKNYMEVSVEHLLPVVLRQYPDICHCEHCSLDIMALALNELKPRYVVSDKGEVFSKANELRIQYEADIVRQLIEAIKVVSERPRH